MKYTKEKNGIKIFDGEDFCPKHILECGQIFCYKKDGDKYIVYPQDKYAQISQTDYGYFIETDDADYFEEFFDLKNDYSLIKQKLSSFKVLEKPLKFGYGIRILNQNLFEILISFIMSSNNNIQRIRLILDKIRRKIGVLRRNDVYSFPTYEKMLSCDEEFFKSVGCGYRAKYFVNVLKQITPEKLEKMRNLDTQSLRKELLSLCGVGPKVADCVLLFGFKKGDVFPVDTWIHQMYNSVYPKLDNREKMRENLVREFGQLSGYAQQYIFYYQRSGESF